MNRILLILTIILSIIYIVLDSSSNTTIFYTDVKKEINVKNTNTNKINKMELEEYVIGVVSAEMPASFEEEALKAQAVASRTYAIYKINTSNKNYDVVTDVSNQGYITIDEMKNKWGDNFYKYYEKIKKAVEDTSGLIMYYNNEVVEAYYFAMSNGYTEEAEKVFSISKDYLKSVESKYDTTLKNFKVNKEISKAEFCQKLNIICDNIEITNIKRSKTNRINEITINNKTFKGTEVRKLLNLRSTDFDILVKDNIIITTKGYGHGVGMSQYAAEGLAKEGYKYNDILKYFYQNIEINSI